MLAYMGDMRAKETGQRVRLCATTTKETSLVPMVGLRRIVVSRPAWFAECATTTSMNPASSTNRAHPLGSTDFGSVVAEVRNWGAVAIGYRAASAQTNPDCVPGGIRVNPPKSEVIDFSAGDTVVRLVGAQ